MLENVPNLKSHDQGASWEIVKDGLKDAGYKFKSRILNASQFGLPQLRPRLFIIGFHESLGKKPKIAHAPEDIEIKPLSSFLEPHKGARDALPGSKKSVATRNLKRTIKRLKRLDVDYTQACIAIDVDSMSCTLSRHAIWDRNGADTLGILST